MCGTCSPSERTTKGVFLAAVLVLMLGASGTEAHAQGRLDVALCVPFHTSGSMQLPVLPFAQVGFQYIAGNFRAGIGLDSLIYIVADLFWAGVFLEYELSPFVLRGDLGGGRVLLVGGYDPPSAFVAAILPQLDLSIKLTDWIRLGVGVLIFKNLEDQSGQVNLTEATLAYAGVRFVLVGAERSNRR